MVELPSLTTSLIFDFLTSINCDQGYWCGVKKSKNQIVQASAINSYIWLKFLKKKVGRCNSIEIQKWGMSNVEFQPETTDFHIVIFAKNRYFLPVFKLSTDNQEQEIKTGQIIKINANTSYKITANCPFYLIHLREVYYEINQI